MPVGQLIAFDRIWIEYACIVGPANDNISEGQAVTASSLWVVVL